MTTTYTKTDNFGLNLYGDNDPADLRDGYNGSMEILDSNLLTVATTANSAKATADQTTTDVASLRQTVTDNKTASDNADNDIRGEVTKLSATVVANKTASDDADNALSTRVAANKDSIDALTPRVTAVENKFGDYYTKNETVSNIRSIAELSPSNWRMLCIGDSYGSGYGAKESTGEDGENIYNYMREILRPAYFYNASVGGAGFVHGASVGGGHQYETQLIDFYNAHRDEAPRITHIVVTGGQNDAGQNNIADAVSNFISSARADFPNAQIWIIPGQYNSLAPTPAIMQAYGEIMSSASINGAITKPYAYSWLLGDDNKINQSVGHPNAQGYRDMGTKLASVLLGSSSDRPRVGSAYTGGAGYTLTRTYAAYEAGLIKLNVEVNGGSNNWSAGTRFAFIPSYCRFGGWFPGYTIGGHMVVMNLSEYDQFDKKPILTVAQVGNVSKDGLYLSGAFPVVK